MIRIGRVEVWTCRGFTGSLQWAGIGLENLSRDGCGCIFLNLGYVGLTWMSKECTQGFVGKPDQEKSP